MCNHTFGLAASWHGENSASLYALAAAFGSFGRIMSSRFQSIARKQVSVLCYLGYQHDYSTTSL